MKKMKAWASCWLALSLLVACGGEEEKESKYPGELGAPCSRKSDCDGDALCTADVDAQDDAPHCYVPCSEDAPCAEGSVCIKLAFVDADKQVTHAQICQPTCSDNAFCSDLHPDRSSCQAWNGQPPSEQSDDAPTYCGIAG
jgi:hypothetical protein